MKVLRSGDNTLERAVSVFLREALAERYSLENIRRYRAFDVLPDTTIIALHDFGLRYIYPEWEERCFQDQVFERLTALLENPLRLSPLTAVALASLFRFGRDLPQAVDAGKQVIGAFEAARMLEKQVLTQIRLQNPPSLKPDDLRTYAAKGLAAVGKEQFDVFVANVVSLMQLLSQRNLLRTGASVMRDLGVAMEKHPALYDEMERAGIHYAMDVMSEGLALFDTLDMHAVEEAIKAIPEVERNWFDTIVRQAASQNPVKQGSETGR